LAVSNPMNNEVNLEGKETSRRNRGTPKHSVLRKV
jgi:hypothetical protein